MLIDWFDFFFFLVRPPQVPIGPKPARLLSNVGANNPSTPSSGSYSSTNGYRPPGNGVNGSSTVSSRHLPISQQAATNGNNSVEYYMPNLQYQQRNGGNTITTSSAHRYPYSSAPSPNNIGLPMISSYSGHHSVTSYVFFYRDIVIFAAVLN